MRAALFVAALALCLSSASGQGQFTAISNVRSAWQLEALWPDPTCPGTCNQGPWIGTTWDTASKTLLTDLCAPSIFSGRNSPPARRIDGNFFKFGTQVWPTGTLAAPRSSRLSSRRSLQLNVAHEPVRCRPCCFAQLTHGRIIPRQELPCPDWQKIANSFPALASIELSSGGISLPCTLPDFAQMPTLIDISLGDIDLTGAFSPLAHPH